MAYIYDHPPSIHCEYPIGQVTKSGVFPKVYIMSETGVSGEEATLLMC